MTLFNFRFSAQPPRTVPVFLEQNLPKNLSAFFKKHRYGSRVIILTDEKVKKCHGEEVTNAIKKAGVSVSMITIPSGEKSKNLTTVNDVVRQMAARGMKRDGCLIALGGGVIGDLGGFAASIFMRGLSCIHIPTTLLSMIDSCLGGKTGVDLPEGKNLIGTFYHPTAIFIDPHFLISLPRSEFRNGIAEMVKHAVIGSPLLFALLEKHIKTLAPNSTNLLTHLIQHNIKIKKKIVEADQQESIRKILQKSSREPRGTARARANAPAERVPGGPRAASLSIKISRMFLNYGHTVGHAIERVSNYEIPHGEAVSIGMCLENIIAVKKGFLKAQTAKRIQNLLRNFGLKTSLPAEISLKAIDRALSTDKKTIGGKTYFALPTRIGAMKLFTL